MEIFSLFRINNLEKEVFSNTSFDFDEMLFQLELYKIVLREELIEKLKPYNASLCEIEDVNRQDEFRDIENTYNVIVDVISNRKIRIINAYSSTKFDFTPISIKLCSYDLEFCTVTKLNYVELNGTFGTHLYDNELLLKRIIIEAVNLKATDIHFSVEHNANGVEYPIYYRSGGRFNRLDLFNIDARLNKEMIRKFVEQKSNSNSIDISDSAGVITSVNNLFTTKPIELRVSANTVLDGTRCVMRIQEKTTTSLQIYELGFAEKVQHGLNILATKRNGITFITGAIRTGKNTTAFALANDMLKAEEKLSLISYDSPIEVLMAFPQVDYKEDPQRLLDCVRLAKKQDIDIAFLNEIPSQNVAFAVKDLVNSSIGVVTTLHLNRLWDLPYRLFEYYGTSYKDVISQINGIVNQKMFGVTCGECRKRIKTFEIDNETIRNFLQQEQISEVFVNSGCPNCYDNRTGNHGTVIGKNQPYAEFLIFTDEIKETLLKCEAPWEMSQYLKKITLEKEQNLEVFLVQAIRSGDLSYQALTAVL